MIRKPAIDEFDIIAGFLLLNNDRIMRNEQNLNR